MKAEDAEQTMYIIMYISLGGISTQLLRVAHTAIDYPSWKNCRILVQIWAFING